jgi:hypothetical protein
MMACHQDKLLAILDSPLLPNLYTPNRQRAQPVSAFH